MQTEQRLARLTPEQMRRRRRLTLQLLWACALALVPWTIYLGLSLPDNYSTRYWSVAWTGFDVLLLLALAATAYFGWRGRQALIGTAIAAATLLVCDAWFDITLDLGTPGIWTALASAVFIELPLAFFLFHRAALLLRLTLLRFFPDGDEQGRPMKLSKLPLIPMLPVDPPYDPDVFDEVDAAELAEAAGDAGNAGDARDAERKPGARDTR